MAYDPLSRSTRVARGRFLIVAASSAFASAFQIQLREIASVKIPFPEQTMFYVLMIVTCYLFVAFLVAYIDDKYNQTAPEAQNITIERLEKKQMEFKDLLKFAMAESPSKELVINTLKKHPDILRDIGFFDKLFKLAEHPQRPMEGGWDDTREPFLNTINQEIKAINEYLKRQGRHRFTEWRLLFFDLLVPIIVFAIAVLGWIGWLDWIAPLLEAETVAAPLSAPQPPIPAMD